MASSLPLPTSLYRFPHYRLPTPLLSFLTTAPTASNPSYRESVAVGIPLEINPHRIDIRNAA
jgi:hypothetical protein